jgi:acyl-CoA reductase-like NAD-dependent aldehyde dehydrogenase
MAYVVARPKGRFEIRESIHTPKGPRARTLANFSELSDEVLDRASQRASRPFDADAVRAAAVRAAAAADRAAADRAAAVRAAAAAPSDARSAAAGVALKDTPRHRRPETRQFVEASRRMARSLERVPPPAVRRDPGDVLIGLLGFVARVKPFGPVRAPEPLGFPLLARLRAERIARASDR